MNAAVCMLDEAATQYGSRVALEDETEVLTYAQYRGRARSIATALWNRGSGRKPIIMYLPKSAAMVCAFMGAQYAGSPYAPVDSHIPMARLQKIIESLNPGVIVTNGELAGNLEGIDLLGAQVALIEDLSAAEADEALLRRTLAQVVDSDPIYHVHLRLHRHAQGRHHSPPGHHRLCRLGGEHLPV